MLNQVDSVLAKPFNELIDALLHLILLSPQQAALLLEEGHLLFQLLYLLLQLFLGLHHFLLPLLLLPGILPHGLYFKLFLLVLLFFLLSHLLYLEIFR